MRRLLLAFTLLATTLPASAGARVINAEDILPPGQSGFVSAAGVADGTGSPHLTDQLPLFLDFKRKPHVFAQPGREEVPRDGVKIVRDGFGVPAVDAADDERMWWGAGYALAQDRLVQLELFRRATTGRLAEILGEGYLDDDLIARRDYYTRGEREQQFERLPQVLKNRMAWYRDGVNAWIQHVRNNPDAMPGEFPALGVQLTDWSIDDSVAVGIFLARTVPSGSGVELENLRALRALGPRAFDALLPLRVPRRIASVPQSDGVFPSQPGRTRAQESDAFKRSIDVSGSWELPSTGQTAAARANVASGLIGQVGGSSMFAVRGRNGRAFLFNGPQLGYSIPELFVEVELRRPGYQGRGVTAAGVPLLAIGHNGDVAWGYTSGLSDEDDLYAEEVVPGAGEKYRFQGADRDMECRDERFTYRSPPTDLLSFPDKVRGAGERVERICRTVHGPVEVRAGGRAYARRYAIWQRELETFEGLTQLQESKTIQDVDRAMLNVTWNENIMAADSSGNIGYWHPGLHPLRPVGYDERLPYPGTGEAEWRGLLDRRETPKSINPKRGWLVNWNNTPSVGWIEGDQEARERLSGGWHRVAWLQSLVRRMARNPSFAAAQKVVELEGTFAQQRPIATTKLRRAQRGARGTAAAVLDALLRWDGSYHRTDGNGTVDPGVPIWEQFKDEAERIALSRLGNPDAAKHLAGNPGKSHQFDISNGEAYALRTLKTKDWREAADATFAALEQRFKTRDVARWREPRKMYEVEAMGAASSPDIPFFDRGTWEQIVEVGP